MSEPLACGRLGVATLKLCGCAGAAGRCWTAGTCGNECGCGVNESASARGQAASAGVGTCATGTSGTGVGAGGGAKRLLSEGAEAGRGAGAECAAGFSAFGSGKLRTRAVKSCGGNGL